MQGEDEVEVPEVVNDVAVLVVAVSVVLLTSGSHVARTHEELATEVIHQAAEVVLSVKVVVVPVVPRYVVDVVVVLVNVVVVVPAREVAPSEMRSPAVPCYQTKRPVVSVDDDDVMLLEVDVTDVSVVETVPQ